MKYFVMLLLLLLLSLAGCSVALTPAGSAVQVMKADPPANCREIGTVSAYITTGKIEPTKNKLRNKAGKLGANYLRWDTASSEVLSGTAFKCP